MKFKSKRIFTDDDFKLYIENFYKCVEDNLSLTRKEISLSFLRQSQVYVILNHNQEMVAGYILGTKSPYRLPSWVPEHKEMSLPENFSWDDCCEVLCVWRNKQLMKWKDVSKHLWVNVFTNVLKTNKKFLLGQSQNAKVDNRYSIFSPFTLYKGETIFGDPSRLFIYSTYKVQALLLYAKYLDKEIKVIEESFHKLIYFLKKNIFNRT